MKSTTEVFTVSAFYHFFPQSAGAVLSLKHNLETWAADLDILGLCLVGPEGLNSTIAGAPARIEAFKAHLRTHPGLEALSFKDSTCGQAPFREFKVKIKSEIVTLNRPDLVPQSAKHRHLSPREWQAAMQDPNAVVLDTRNDYEVDIGKFRNAIDLRLNEFRQFPERLRQASIAKDQPVLIYCTGGIRCEKAILEMEKQGYEQVYQLDGGILNYLKELPHAEFAGECFVFDYRVAVDQELQPTAKYDLCPHCGQPAATSVQCTQCGRDEIICAKCHDSGERTCSKNCAHHHRIHSKSSRPHLQELHKRHRI